MNSNLAVINMNEYRYEKCGNNRINLNDDTVYNRHSDNKEIRREMIKACMKLLSANI